MDLWLENRVLWQGFHNKFVAYCETALNRALPEGVVATTELRIQRTDGHDIRPDVGVALAERPHSTPLVVPLPPLEERQAYITLRDALFQERVLTVIEVLSPSNKTGRGYDQYRAKQAEFLDSETSLVEIDLLRGGFHTVAVPMDSLRERGAQWNYVVCLHDVADRGRCKVWPLTLADRLPEIPIPLGSEYAPVTLDLQAVFDECYDTGRFRTLLRYDTPPETPFTDDEAQWVQERLAGS